MRGPKALQRLLRIRDLQEEQERSALESATGQLRKLEAARQAAREGERQGRVLVGESIVSGDVTDRHAGGVQEAQSRKLGRILAGPIVEAEAETVRLRQSFLQRRLERRQVEKLVEKSAAADALESSRDQQRAVDDWHGSRRFAERVGGRG